MSVFICTDCYIESGVSKDAGCLFHINIHGTAAMMLRHTEIFISDTSFQLHADIMEQQIFCLFMSLWHYIRYLHAIINCIC